MRIVGGEFKGRRIAVPSNFPSRPTTDFAKEGLFNVLENQVDLTELKILDLCSGT
jgi:16S rRNA (guanine966-N2)-methyltransferase